MNQEESDMRERVKQKGRGVRNFVINDELYTLCRCSKSPAAREVVNLAGATFISFDVFCNVFIGYADGGRHIGHVSKDDESEKWTFNCSEGFELKSLFDSRQDALKTTGLYDLEVNIASIVIANAHITPQGIATFEKAPVEVAKSEESFVVDGRAYRHAVYFRKDTSFLAAVFDIRNNKLVMSFDFQGNVYGELNPPNDRLGRIIASVHQPDQEHPRTIVNKWAFISHNRANFDYGRPPKEFDDLFELQRDIATRYLRQFVWGVAFVSPRGISLEEVQTNKTVEAMAHNKDANS